MPRYTNLVWSYDLPECRIRLYGATPTMKHSRAAVSKALATASSDGAQPNKISIVAPASSPCDDWFQAIEPALYSIGAERQRADGIILTEYSSAGCMPTGDCPTIIFAHRKKLLLIHAGRWQLAPSKQCACPYNIVSQAFAHFSERERTELAVVIVGAIAPEHFRHDDRRGQKLIEPFVELYGEKVFRGPTARGELDLVMIIRQQCLGYGVSEERIIWDELDTFSHPKLASHRQQVANGVTEKQYRRNLIFAHKT